MNKKFLIIGGILLIAILAAPLIFKSSKIGKDEDNNSVSQSDQQCKALTASGERCKRKSLSGQEFCWQHQN